MAHNFNKMHHEICNKNIIYSSLVPSQSIRSQIFSLGKWLNRNHESRESTKARSRKLSVSISTKSSKFAVSAREMG